MKLKNEERLICNNFSQQFSQNPEIKKHLLSTKGTTLVEASPRDRIWGIGLSATNPDAQNKEKWRGKNLLGYILTDVRDVIETDEDDQKRAPSDDDDKKSSKKAKTDDAKES